MKKVIYSIAIALILAVNSAQAQEFKLDKSSGSLIIHEVKKVTIIGHDENYVLIEREGKNSDNDDRASGLKMINPEGLTDNTGVGLDYSEDGAEYTFRQVAKSKSPHFIFKVPKGIKVSYEYSDVYGSSLTVKDVSSEIEVSTNYNSVTLDNVTGPMAINTVYGGIEATFGEISQENSISLYSVYGSVDVTVPPGNAASFRLNTTYGEMYTDLDLKFENQSSSKSNRKIYGHFNGGGVDFSIQSTYSNIYLRKS